MIVIAMQKFLQWWTHNTVKIVRFFDRVAVMLGRSLAAVAEFIVLLVYPRGGVSLISTVPKAGPRTPSPSVGDRLVAISDELRRSGAEAEQLIAEATDLLEDRAERVEQLHREISGLEAEYEQAAEDLEQLRSIKPEAAATLASLMDDSLDARDARAGRRDLVLFVLGVVATLVIDGIRSLIW